MKRKILLCAAAMLLASTTLAQPVGAGAQTPPPPPSAAAAAGAATTRELPEGPGKAVIQTACTRCHSIDVVLGQPRTPDQWNETVARMIGAGVQLTDDEYVQLMDYLSAHYTPAATAAH